MTVKNIGVGMLGYAFMGKAHSYAFKNMPLFFWPPPAVPELVSIFGRTDSKVAEAAQNFGFKKYTTDWHEVIEDKEVEIIDNCLPNDMHHDISIEAIEAGKHVICEKPLAMNSRQAKEMWDVARKNSVKSMVAFNYRFVPAVGLAREIVRSERLGRIYHFRARYLQQWLRNPNTPLVWRLDKEKAGSGPIGDLGSHVFDIIRFVMGEVKAVTAISKTFVKERPLPTDKMKKGKVSVEDAFESIVEFENGATGTVEASRMATGRKNYNNFEINGEKGSIEFDMERLNELRFYSEEGDVSTIGWNNILVTESVHPFVSHYWPSGHVIGWGDTFVNEIYHFMDVVVNDKRVDPIGATFEDGYKNNVILDAIIQSTLTGKKTPIVF
ncbi:MAG: Gfo/Idh/MocA family oxidoreductase [Nitrososphaeria archaeon]|jgi:predicted dehydrogenase